MFLRPDTMRSIDALSLLAMILELASHTSALCYYPNGTASDDVPCNEGAGDTFCCGISYACLSNKLCYGTIGSASAHFGRGSCSDKTCKIGPQMLDLFCNLVLTSTREQQHCLSKLL